jgi:hypothetical protein
MKCINCPPSEKDGCYYTGKENTPRGRGFCAMHEKIGSKKKGKNGLMYKVVKIKGGTRRWKKISSRNTSPRGEIYDNLMAKYQDLLYFDMANRSKGEYQHKAKMIEEYCNDHPHHCVGRGPEIVFSSNDIATYPYIFYLADRYENLERAGRFVTYLLGVGVRLADASEMTEEDLEGYEEEYLEWKEKHSDLMSHYKYDYYPSKEGYD